MLYDQHVKKYISRSHKRDFSAVALGRKKRFDLIYTLAKVFVFGVKYAVVWFSEISIRYPTWFGAVFFVLLCGLYSSTFKQWRWSGSECILQHHDKIRKKFSDINCVCGLIQLVFLFVLQCLFVCKQPNFTSEYWLPLSFKEKLHSVIID